MELGNKIVYQIYPKSFQDTNGDGIGDLRGIIRRLDYLQELGVDYLWLTPFYLSPQNDNGYDIADYRRIDPMYGTMEDFELLVKEAAQRGIYLMLDMVLNHCSTQHEWFQRALAGDAYYRDFFIFRKGKNGQPPTNWESAFGGDAWSYLPQTDEYYLHLFHVTQADLNWDNPHVRQACYDIINFWIGKGVKGFRFDVINLISKPAVFEDDPTGNGKKYYTDGPHVHEYLHELNQNTFGRYNDIITVGEMSSTTLEHCIRYSNPAAQELAMVFNFHHLRMDYPSGNKWEIQPFRFHDLKRSLFTWQREMEKGGGWNALFWYNHDQPRILSRIGDEGRYRLRSAKMLATALHGLKGTPYIYQGEEIGMTNAGFTDISQYRDIESLNYYTLMKRKGKPEAEIYESLGKRSRDNARTPMQWDDTAYAGFSRVEPWIQVNPNHKQINTLDRAAESSIFAYYQQLIRLRKSLPVLANGHFTALLEQHESILAYKRSNAAQELYVFCNFFAQEAAVPMALPGGCRCILSNYSSQPRPGSFTLRPYEAAIFLKENCV